MKRTLAAALIVIAVTVIGAAKASWVSEITGVSVDLNRGKLSVKPPNISAIPKMIENLPKDVGQALLNPNAPILASAIRFSRGQALNRGAMPIPADIRQELTPYFPPDILDKARWTTANGISIDGALTNWFNQEGAITYDEVIVFANPGLTKDVKLWAHELTHVLQYSQIGVETFAFQYLYDWNGLENQASENASRIFSSISSSSKGMDSSWGYEGEQASSSQQLSWSTMNHAAKISIPAQNCIWINNQMNTTGNICPVAIMVSGVVIRRLSDGYTFTSPCNEPTCLFQPGQSGPLLSPHGHIIIGVTAAYEQ